jgi:tetratricopeptide (TPR) repeat protein
MEDSARRAAYQQGHEFLVRGNVRTALPLLLAVAEAAPNHFDSQYDLGVCYFRIGEFQAAEERFRQALRLDNGRHLAHYYLGLALERQNRSVDAMFQYKFALTVKPDFEEAKKKLGLNDPILPRIPSTDSGAGLDLEKNTLESPRAAQSEQRAVTIAEPANIQPLQTGALLREGRRRWTSFDIELTIIAIGSLALIAWLFVLF